MSIRFAIKHAQSKAEKEGDTIVRFTGVSEPFNKASERDSKPIGQDAKGNPKLQFITGLDEKRVKFFKWYTEEEKAEIIKQIKELRPLISDFYGGEEAIADTNDFFWRDNREVSRLALTNSSMDIFFDTKNIPHALLYLSIISGAFMDLVAPTRDWAERHQIPHYLVLETDDAVVDDDSDLTRSDAHAALAELRKDESPEALFILAWCIQYDTNAFGAYLKSTSQRDLVNYHIKYIDGKLVTKRKRDTAKHFLDYYKKWKGQQTRPTLYAEAYVKAGEYYNFLQKVNKKYQLGDGSELGGTVTEVVDNLMKPKFSADLEKLRDQVENKWKE